MLDYIFHYSEDKEKKELQFHLGEQISESKRLQIEKIHHLPGYLQTPSYAIAECRMAASKQHGKYERCNHHSLTTFCKCGAEIDRLGYHFYVCLEKAISSKVRYKMHTALKEAH
jgi:hypothetical protein